MVGRSAAASTISSIEPTARARSTVWTASNSAATSATFSARTVACIASSSDSSAARAAGADAKYVAFSHQQLTGAKSALDDLSAPKSVTGWRVDEQTNSVVVEVNRLENQADKAHRKLLAQLFDEITDPILLMKLKEVVEKLEDAADAFEKVANTVETIALKES